MVTAKGSFDKIHKNRKGRAAGIIMGRKVGRLAAQMFNPVMTAAVISVSRALLTRLADNADVKVTHGEKLNKQPFQVDPNVLASMTTMEAIKSGLVHGFSSAAKGVARKAPDAKAAPPKPKLQVKNDLAFR